MAHEGFSVYIGLLSPDVNEEDLIEAFSPFGQIISARIIREPPEYVISKGFGFIYFASEQLRQEIVGMHRKMEVKGNLVALRIGKKKNGSDGGGLGGLSSLGGGGLGMSVGMSAAMTSMPTAMPAPYYQQYAAQQAAALYNPYAIGAGQAYGQPQAAYGYPSYGYQLPAGYAAAAQQQQPGATAPPAANQYAVAAAVQPSATGQEQPADAQAQQTAPSVPVSYAQPAAASGQGAAQSDQAVGVGSHQQYAQQASYGGAQQAYNAAEAAQQSYSQASGAQAGYGQASGAQAGYGQAAAAQQAYGQAQSTGAPAQGTARYSPY